MLPHATPCGAAAKHAAEQRPGSLFAAVPADKGYLSTPRVCIREGIHSPGISPTGTSTLKRRRVGDMRPLDLSGPPDADGRKVRFGYEEVVANSAAADLTDSEFFQGMLFTGLDDPPLPALDIDIEGASTPGIEGASTPASGRASTPASGRASTPGIRR